MIRKVFFAFHIKIYRRNISVFISLFVCFLCTGPLFTQPGDDRWKKFSAREVAEDIEFLQKKLEANHPNLYLYHSKSLLDGVFDSLRNILPDSLTALEVYKHITILSSLIKDGHTLILPGERILEDHNKNSRFLPYHFSIIGDQLYPGMVCTADSSLETGDEVIRINNYSAAQIIEALMERQVRDGYNLTYPTWILSNYFRE